MSCPLISAKWSTEPMITYYYELAILEHISMKF